MLLPVPLSPSGRRIAFVPPRYGEDVVGGAESVMSELAHGLAARGHDIEVLTTCARDHFTWANVYPAGSSHDGAITVRRFPTVISSGTQRPTLEAAILRGEPVTVTQQERWMNGGLRCPELFHWLLDHQEDYDLLVFAPYLFWTTYAGAQVAPGRSVIMPCLHDEPYAYLDLFQPLFTGSRGLWFLSEPEHALAHRIFGMRTPHEVIGSGITVPQSYDVDGFRERHGIAQPFVLFAGRREGAKGWERMLSWFTRAVQRYDLPFLLLTMGVGAVHPPVGFEDRIIDLGFLPAPERDAAFAAAAAYLQPSRYESFSRTIMEAWLAGTLVIGNGASAVVRWHCERSGAGLTYDDEPEFQQCLVFLAQEPDAAAALAARGRAYVLEHYTHERVLDRVEATLAAWTESPAGSKAS